MSRMKKYVGIAVLVGLVAALGISSVASAQSSITPTPTAPPAQTAPPAALPGEFGPRELRSQAALEAAANALGMTADELSAELWGGKTLADIADEKSVDIADVKAAVEAAQIAETKTAIEQAVTDGIITQDKADWLIEGLGKGYWGAGAEGDFGFGMGMGMGPGMGHGGPRGGGPNGAPPSDAAPNSNSTTSSSTN